MRDVRFSEGKVDRGRAAVRDRVQRFGQRGIDVADQLSAGFAMGKRHSLPLINIMNKDGTLNENAGEFEGQERFAARRNIVAKLEELGNLVKIEAYKHTVPYSDRGKVPVEPLLSTQWFVKIRPMADNCLELRLLLTSLILFRTKMNYYLLAQMVEMNNNNNIINKNCKKKYKKV